MNIHLAAHSCSYSIESPIQQENRNILEFLHTTHASPSNTRCRPRPHLILQAEWTVRPKARLSFVLVSRILDHVLFAYLVRNPSLSSWCATRLLRISTAITEYTHSGFQDNRVTSVANVDERKGVRLTESFAIFDTSQDQISYDVGVPPFPFCLR